MEQPITQIVQWSPAVITANTTAIQAIFAAAFAMDESAAARFMESLARHSERRDFRFFAACDQTTGALLGFIYGYSGEPGQWFHDLLNRTLDPALVAHWLPHSYEVVEFGVLPTHQGQGIGGRLHDTLLAHCTNPTAILTTPQDNERALQLYRQRGWQQLQAGYRFPNNTKAYVILGLPLPHHATL